MTTIIITNAVFSAFVVAGIVGSLAYSITSRRRLRALRRRATGRAPFQSQFTA